MKTKYFAFALFVVLAAIVATSLPAAQTTSPGDQLIVYGDVVYFVPPREPLSCVANTRYKRGDSIGWRITALDPVTRKRDRASQLVVHLTVGGNTIDIPMRDRENERSPEKPFWIAKWIVPADAPIGIVRYTVTAKDSQGRTGEYQPFQVKESQLTIVE